MKKLKNCPNCGGTLQDDGRCRFCGSKVYDLCDIDLGSPFKAGAVKYLRVKYDGKIITTPVRFNTFSFDMRLSDTFAECHLDFYVVGETIFEKAVQEND